MSTRTEILDTAKQYVSADRQSQYGEPEDNFATIAAFWADYLGVPLNAYDVALMMALLKIARMKAHPKSPDSAIDLAGYAACAGEILERMRRKGHL
jgi:hypothetical protein